MPTNISTKKHQPHLLSCYDMTVFFLTNERFFSTEINSFVPCFALEFNRLNMSERAKKTSNIIDLVSYLIVLAGPKGRKSQKVQPMLTFCQIQTLLPAKVLSPNPP